MNISRHSFWAYKVSAEKYAHSHMEVTLCITDCFFLAAFKIEPLSLTFEDLIIMYVGVGLFGFILFETFAASWIWISVSFPRLVKFSAIIS